MNKKTCKVCSERFTPSRSFQKVCENIECAVTMGQETFKKQKLKEGRKKLKAFNMGDVAVLKRKAQTIFNKYIRLRDDKLSCISCGHDFKGANPRQKHAGHFRPQGGNSLIRYEVDNCHAQCSICNNYKSGNLVPYRKNLIEKIGLCRVEELETMNTIKKWSVDELIEICTIYTNKVKDLSCK